MPHKLNTTSTRAFSSDLPPLAGPAPFTILYGSQTGTAMGFAHELNKQSNKRPEFCSENKVVDLAEFNAADLLALQGRVVFVTACFGHGEPTDSARAFHTWLMSKDREADRAAFAKLRYCVFGLGQSKHYPERYQQVSKEIDARLAALGAHRFMPRGEGDDSQDIENDFEKWCDQLWATIGNASASAEAKASPAVAAAAPAAAAPEKPVKSCATVPITPPAAAPQQQQHSSASASASTSQQPHAPNVRRPFHATIMELRELHTDKSKRSCKHIELDISNSGIKFTTGDYLGVFPQNDAAEVEALARLLRMAPESPVKIAKHAILAQAASFNPELAADTLPLHVLLTKYCDISSIPRRTVIRDMALYAGASAEKAKLSFLASNSVLGQADYNSWVVDAGKTVRELLECFPSISVTPDELVDLLPPLQNRFYSISSSSHVSQEKLSITVAVARKTTPSGRLHKGVCSSFLSAQKVGNKVPVFVKESMFRLPADPKVPIIMVGAGTGFAPFRAFIHERALIQDEGKQVGQALLFFGVDRRDTDFIYKTELLERRKQRQGTLQLQMAFAFEQPWRVFVQHKIIEVENSKKVWRMLNEGAHVYVCGDGKLMAPAVHEALTVVVAKEGNMSREAAQEYLKGMQNVNRYQLDVF